MQKIQSILGYTTGEIISDGLIKIPYLIASRRAYPNTKIIWRSDGLSVYTHELKPIIQNFVIPFTGTFQKVKKEFKRFNLIIDAQKKFFNSMKLKLIPHQIFLSNSAKGLFSTIKPHSCQSLHDIDRLFKLTELAGSSLYFKREPFLFMSSEREIAKKILPYKSFNRYVGLIVGAGQVRKRWPIKNFIRIAQFLLQRDFQPVFILGPHESHLYPQLRQIFPNAYFPLQHQLSMKSSLFTIAVAERLRFAISNDCGGGHMVACADIPLISLFGPPCADKVAPLVENGIIIRAQDFGGDDISLIPVDEVINKINSIN